MTTERWTDEMVDQLAASVRELRQSDQETRNLVNSNARAIEAQRQSDQETRDLVNSNARVIQALANTAAEAQEEREAAAREREAATRERQAILARIDEMTTEIRGLQVENQRMLDLIFEYIRRNDDQDDNE